MVAVFIILAYLIGSIPTAVWIGKTFYNIDVREFGSGNAGATNTFRVLGQKAGIPVLIIDILKGATAVSLAFLSSYIFESDEFVNLQLALGIAALVGHIFPVFAGFRGGKGVATILGIVMCILPLSCCVSLIVFLIVLFTSRMVSLSSMIGGFAFPFILHFVFGNTNPILTSFSIVVALLLIITHRKNIIRIVNKQESKIKFLSKKISL
ncbi:MAG: glycerol-3-phosphate 1-O-acyltransferase PlsY [Bacteroidota bacterium]|nr:glycerol-3-phosphate 1-O-acyltransferase PlsY [Bacteroidota bacterium]MDP3144070.1 glycerol-3-phosphate 1-O-acyltransferase PlsY [Bacteroidota bacterium]